ncbi:histidine phosphatase family protein [Marinicrinis lubricantis]|uniref:Histidine phosphatase family protein n=1 Tax=Marinicrinis lubricantis TaxID=2086470 RepID=A0ABW1IVE3_9BACL
MTRLIMLRHGETEWNAANNRFCGHSDIPLSETGRRQAEAAADWLKDIHVDHIYASTLQRAVETAAFIAHRHQLPVKQEQDLQEINYGRWEGLTQPEIEQQYPHSWSGWFRQPEDFPAGEVGENALQLYNRYEQCIHALCARHSGEHIVIVSHSAAIRIFLTGVLQMPLRAYRKLVLHNTGVCVLETAPEGVLKLLQFNGKPHAL